MKTARKTKPRRADAARPSGAGRSALIVLGMHRSGTSALAGVLGQMGCDLPQDLMEPAPMNAKGFFESNRITGLNEELLASAGFTWYSVPRFPADWFASPKAGEFALRAQEVLRDEFGQSHLFVMKDPRICRLLPFWHDALETADCRPLHVCTHRHPLDVAASLTRWANYEPGYGLVLWLRHVLDAEAESRGRARVFTSYDRLLTDWTQEIGRIGQGLGLKWPRSPETAAPAVAGFLSNELRHFNQTADADRRGQVLPDWVAEAHAILDRWAVTGEDAADHPVLDRIRDGLDAASPSFVPIVRRSQELRLEGQNRQQSVERLSDEARNARQEAASHAANHRTEQKTRAAAEARAKELAQALDEIRASAESHAANHRAEQQARAAAEARVKDLAQALDEARASAESQAASLRAAQQARTAAESRANDLARALDEAHATADSHAANHRAEQQARAAAEARANDLATALTEARASAGSHAANHRAEQQARAAAEARANDLAAALAEARASADSHAANHRAEQLTRAAAEAGAEALTARIAEMQQMAELQAAEVQAGQDRAEALQARQEALEAELSRSEETRSQQEQDLHRLQSMLLQRSQEIDDMQRQHLEDQTRIATMEATLGQLRQAHADLDRRARRSAGHLDQMSRRVAAAMRRDLLARLDGSATPAAAAETPVELPAPDPALTEAAQAAIRSEYEARLTEAAVAQNRLAGASAALEAELAARDAALRAAEARHAADMARLEAEVRQLQAGTDTTSGLKQELTRLREAHAEAQKTGKAETDRLRKQARDATAEIRRLAAQMSQQAVELEESRAAAEARIAESVAEAEALRQAGHEEREALLARMREIEADNAALRDSTSWRVTAPLRKLSLAVRRRQD
ncbi:hypothetical protein D2N39_18400 [Gemmobacter lutimaris]|uniref:Sulfotransferase family protein n=1 Tax=Gemmobacter lutimaris TaxID=2306023 RepID=A0A398BL98_9RHOB|nr:sulfotransferase [Gemmobacter lutimaris]RID90337.1 hypothetical protein D2N39_18400 [Gemmobacter lutimaris]